MRTRRFSALFRGNFHADLHVVDARARFLQALEGISDPQEKRRIIGHVFIDVFKDEALHIENARFLAQGTLYPDVIESGTAVDGPGLEYQNAPQRWRTAQGVGF